MDISIIIVNYNVKEFVSNLIQSIKKSACEFSYEIIIVDNNSNDGSVDYLKEKYTGDKNLKIIANNNNAGFGKANNQGVKEASGKYLLLINPDTLIQEDTIPKMIWFFKSHPDAGMAGCKILNPDGTLQLACRRSFPGPWTSFTKISGLSTLFPKSKVFSKYNLTYLDENKTYEVDAISGSFMFLPRKIFEEINGFDEDFFMYGEDLDICFRVQQMGYKVYYYHETQIIHYKGESTKRSPIDENKVFYDAMTVFVNKHMASSFLVNIILRAAIIIKSFLSYWNRRKLILVSIIFDFILFNTTLYTASKVYSLFNPNWHGFPDVKNTVILTFPAIIHIFSAIIFKVYKKDSFSVIKNLSAIVVSFFIMSSFTFFFKEFAYSRAVVIINYTLLFFFLSGWRILAKLVFDINKDKTHTTGKKAIIIGTGEAALKISQKMKDKKTHIHTIVGLIGKSNSEIGKNYNGLTVIGSLENFYKVLREYKIDEVIMSSEELTYHKMVAIVSSCQNENVEFKLAGNDLDFIVGKSSVSVLNDMPLINLTYNISDPTMKILKRTFDIVLGLFVLLFAVPFFKVFSSGKKGTKDFNQMLSQIPEVVKGAKSFVGPKYSNPENQYMGKQGLTGFWYIENAEDEDLEKLDIYYAKNQNLWLDIEILSKSISKIMNTKN